MGGGSSTSGGSVGDAEGVPVINEFHLFYVQMNLECLLMFKFLWQKQTLSL